MRHPPHFKVFVSIQNHKRAAFWTDPVLRGIWVGLGVMAVERYADKTGDSFLLTGRELMDLTGCGGVPQALARLRRLEGQGGPSVRPEGGRWRASIRNFAKKQFNRSEPRTLMSAPSSSSSSSSIINKNPKTEKEARAAQSQEPACLDPLIDHLIARFDSPTLQPPKGPPS